MRILGLGFSVEALGLEDLVSRAWGLAFSGQFGRF